MSDGVNVEWSVKHTCYKFTLRDGEVFYISEEDAKVLLGLLHYLWRENIKARLDAL